MPTIDHTITIRNHETGEVQEIARCVTVHHPQWVHDQLGTQSESELQAVLDQYHASMWYDAMGDHLGEDGDGLSIHLNHRSPTMDPTTIRHNIKDSLASLQAAVTLLLSGVAPQGLASAITEATALCAAHKNSPDVLTKGMVHQLHTIAVFLGTCLEDAQALQP